MSIYHPTLFKVSLTAALVSVVQIGLAFKIMIDTATTDFNFGFPFIIMAGIGQVLVSLYGIYMSIKK